MSASRNPPKTRKKPIRVERSDVRPEDVTDHALLPRRFEQHIEDDRTKHDVIDVKIDRLSERFDDVVGELRTLGKGLRKLYAMADAAKKQLGNGNGNGGKK